MQRPGGREAGPAAEARPAGASLPPRTAPPPRTGPRAFRVIVPVALGLVLAGGVAAAAFGPVVRGKVAAEAERRHLDVELGAVRPGFFAVVLRRVRVSPRGVPGLALELDEVRVDLTAGLSLREIAAHGGRVLLEGEPEEIRRRVEETRRASTGTGGEGGAPRSRVPVAAHGITVAWKAPSGASVKGEGIHVARGDDGVRLGAAALATTYDRLGLELRGLEVELAPEGTLRKVGAATLDVSVAPDPKAAPAEPPKAAPAEPAPPPLPVVIGKPPKGGKGAPAKPALHDPARADEAPSEERVLPAPDLKALRARLANVARELDARVPDGLRVDIGGLSVKLDAANEPIAFGPGPFSLDRRGGALHVLFASGDGTGRPGAPVATTGAGSAGTPLSLDLELPFGAGDVVARLAGGPVSLAMLGVKEGQKGLSGVTKGMVSGKGKLALAADGQALTFDGELALRNLAWNQPRIAPEPMKNLSFGTSARGVLDAGGKLRIDEAQLDVGALHLRAHGTVEESSEHFGLSLGLEVAPAGCQALLASAPEGLMPTVQGMRLSGTFGANVQVAFDTRTIDKMLLDYKIDDGCRVLEVPRELSRERFSKSFTYRTYHPDAKPFDTTTGPGTSSWTDLQNISPFMVAAVLTTEDGAFYKHHGFNHNAIRGSVQANLKAKRFVRGASTISMQLAKNLFLTRSKNLSRKLEEVILTDYLEQVFQKDEVMELYLNVVEFGPDVYGVTQAAEHYFGRKPEELNVAEAFFLATLLPSPLRLGKLREKGQVPDTWMAHLRRLMEIAAKTGKISRAELAEGLEQSVVFVRLGEARPEPRKPISSKRRDPYEDDASWQPLD